MTLEEFKGIKDLEALAGTSEELRSLWCDYKDQWHAAHDLVDGKPGWQAAWVHAYLHRKEGDQWNADYWYQRANKTRPGLSLDEEWEHLAAYFLQNQ
ncbi:MAG: hypothetical protein KTR24_18000 [Saprospiraceae bacterium]|nr:hypothetical protein [Saprospiraceae bacterium]